MTHPLRIAVLGCGRIGQMHAELLARRVPGATVSFVYDAVPEASASVGARLGIPVASSVDEILGSDQVDAVAICSSTDTHVELMIGAAQAGKAIFCEKPVSLDLEQVDRGLDAVDRSGVPFMVGFNRRFDPTHKAVRDAVVGGQVGDVHLVRITSRDPAPPPIAYIKVSGGIFCDMTIHDFDMVRFLLGEEPVAVLATAASLVSAEIAAIGDIDTASVSLQTASGKIATITNSRRCSAGYDQRIEVHCANGMARTDNVPKSPYSIETASGVERDKPKFFFTDRYAESYAAEWAHFVQVLDGSAVANPTGIDGYRALLLAEAAYISLAEGRRVTVAETEARVLGATT